MRLSRDSPYPPRKLWGSGYWTAAQLTAQMRSNSALSEHGFPSNLGSGHASSVEFGSPAETYEHAAAPAGGPDILGPGSSLREGHSHMIPGHQDGKAPSDAASDGSALTIMRWVYELHTC
jgi:hypothetical protein